MVVSSLKLRFFFMFSVYFVVERLVQIYPGTSVEKSGILKFLIDIGAKHDS